MSQGPACLIKANRPGRRRGRDEQDQRHLRADNRHEQRFANLGQSVQDPLSAHRLARGLNNRKELSWRACNWYICARLMKPLDPVPQRNSLATGRAFPRAPEQRQRLMTILFQPKVSIRKLCWRTGAGLSAEEPITIEAIAAIGNLFLKGASGRIYLLSIEDGTCECIADSVGVFHEKLGDRHHRRAWLEGLLVRELRQKGILLEPGQCYGRPVPLHLGGHLGIENIEPADLTVHVSMLGQLHKQTRSLRPGSAIDGIHIA